MADGTRFPTSGLPAPVRAHSRFEQQPGSSRAESDLYRRTAADLRAAGWPVMTLDCTRRRPETIALTIAIPILHTYRERSQA
jgi:hypothetical protein